MRASLSTFNSKKTFFKTILFIIILSTTILVLGLIMENSFYQEYSSKFKDINNIDIAILGSSQAEAAYDSDILSELTNLNVVNIAAKGQQPDSTYYILKDLLSSNSPKLVVLDVYWRTLDGSVDLSQLIRSYESIQNSTIKKEFFSQGFTLANKLEYKLPILRYRQGLHWFFESSISNLLSKDKGNESSILDTDVAVKVEKVNAISDKKLYKENKFRHATPMNFNPLELEYLDKIVTLCINENIPILVVAAPVLPESINLIKDYDFIHNSLSNLFDAHGLTYIDYNLLNYTGEILDRQYYKDENHMNTLGAKEFSQRFYSDYLKSSL